MSEVFERVHERQYCELSYQKIQFCFPSSVLPHGEKVSSKAERMSSRKIQGVLRYCEENFEKGNLEHALRCAVSVSLANPDALEPYAHVTAYRILLTAANNVTVTGEPDWYTVFGIQRGSSSKSVARSIERHCLKILELLNGEAMDFKAALMVYDLLSRGMDELTSEERRRAYDQRSGFSL